MWILVQSMLFYFTAAQDDKVVVRAAGEKTQKQVG